MSEVSIQIRRVTERVKQYFSIFGLRSTSVMVPGRSVIHGSKRLGFDEIECVVAETSRGTSVGFYAVNQLQGLLNSIPFLFVLLLVGLNRVNSISGYLQGTKGSISIDWIYLLAGNARLNFTFVLILVVLILVPVLTEFIIQRIRLENLKSRFSFYSRDAIWKTREIPHSLIALQSFRSIFMHGWLLAIIYFAGFSPTDSTVSDLTRLYNADLDQLVNATIDAFSITGGLVIGLLTTHKAISLRREYGRTDERLRFSGSLMERRIDPILFGLQASLINGLLFLSFLSVTYFGQASFQQAVNFLLFIMLGALIGGFIHDENQLWFTSAYAIFIFFTSLVLIFRTGSQPGYAYIVVLQLFLVPIPFIMYLSNLFEKFMVKNSIRTKQFKYDILPITSFLTLFNQRRQREAAKLAYERSMQEDLPEDAFSGRITIKKSILDNRESDAYKMVRHYFELLFTYTASFDGEQFILLPTESQLKQWWEKQTAQKSDDTQDQFIRVTDKLLWDPEYQGEHADLSRYEQVGKQMVLAIK